MPKIIGPNGLPVNVSDVTAEMLLRNSDEYKLAETAEEKAERKAAKKAAKKAAADQTTDDTRTDGDTGTPPAADAPTKPVWPSGTAEAWAAYATHLGLGVDGLDRTAIRDVVEAHEAAGNNS